MRIFFCGIRAGIYLHIVCGAFMGSGTCGQAAKLCLHTDAACVGNFADLFGIWGIFLKRKSRTIVHYRGKTGADCLVDDIHVITVVKMQAYIKYKILLFLPLKT